jgi:hypothetical protein
VPGDNCRFCPFGEILGAALTDVAADYEAAMRTFPIRQATLLGLIAASLVLPPKLQLLSSHAEEKSLAIYWDLALTDVSAEYEEATRSFPVR